MSSHVAVPKMRLSKLLFIAMIAICVVFMKVNAGPDDEMAVENEGGAMAPGAQAVEAGPDGGETQVAGDMVRSQGGTTRGPTRSQNPSKMQKSNKLKIAIIIGMILLVLAGTMTAVGVLAIRPMRQKKANKALSEKFGKGLPDGVKIEQTKLGKDKKEGSYMTGGEKLAEDKEKVAADLFKKLGAVEKATTVGDNKAVPIKTLEDQKAICKALGSPMADKCDKPEEFTAGVLGGAVGGGRALKFQGGKVILMEVSPAKEDKDKK